MTDEVPRGVTPPGDGDIAASGAQPRPPSPLRYRSPRRSAKTSDRNEVDGAVLAADAGLGRLRLHDLRHTAASQAVLASENLPLVIALLGHRRHRTTAGYAHLADAHLVKAAETVNVAIAAAMAGGSSAGA